MKISELNDITPFKILFENKNNREIKLYLIQGVSTCGVSNYYPNVLFYRRSDNQVINPINESVMSLKESPLKIEFNLNSSHKSIDENDYFFFVYNTDNYYHFVYDTLPYLISYLEIRKENKNIKLLMNCPNFQKKDFYPFVVEFLNLFEIKSDDIEIIRDDVEYQNVYISNSFTHDGMSDNPPRDELYTLFYDLVQRVLSVYGRGTNLPKKIYVSRRTHLHNDLSNIGTNYTDRRQLINEDELVRYLNKKGFVEVFTEKMSIIEKIQLFNNCDSIVGPIGGGLCNAIFSKPNTDLTVISSPTFFDINSRFKFCFRNTNTKYFEDTFHKELGHFKTYMRVHFNGRIGEISEIKDKSLVVNCSYTPVSGWNRDLKFDKIEVPKEKCQPLDGGLNSPWFMDLDKFEKIMV